MSKKAQKYCASFPCKNLAVDGAYCAEHRPPRAAKDTDPFYLSTRWRKFRDWYITNQPLCEVCEREKRLTRAVMVDHIIELEDGGAPLAEGNAQALCWKCHAVKTANTKEKRNKNNQLGSKDNRLVSTKVS